ncbi:uncharacterized protein BJX67DRAFT_352398 [Aspergillus lucknowensis]|uniref:Rhodopsin domain-containing protein n=1 Tax=Aspergillus lucknowensis TaxID=176173 RepID=A0ABR4LTI0_9EURO
MSTPSLLPPLAEIGPDNHGPIVSVIAFIFLSIMVIVVLVKTASMIHLRRLVLSVDLPIWISAVVAFVQTLLIQFAVDHGMGKHSDVLSSDTLDTYYKVNYAAQLLLPVILSLSKLSTSNLIQSINPSQTIKRYCLLTQIAIGTWLVLVLFGTAFQCQSPFWKYDPGRCVGEGAIVYPIMAFNMMIEATLVILPIGMLWNIQMPWDRRLKVMALFASRIAAIVVNVFLLVYMPQYLHSTDTTWTIVNVTVCNQVMMNTSIITACIPTLYRVINSLAAGLVNVHISGELELRSSRISSRVESRTTEGAHSKSPHSRGRKRSSRPLDEPKRAEPGGNGLCIKTAGVTATGRDAARADSTESTGRSHDTAAGDITVTRTVDIWVNIDTDVGKR